MPQCLGVMEQKTSHGPRSENLFHINCRHKAATLIALQGGCCTSVHEEHFN